MKAILTSEVRKSVLEKLAFTKFWAFTKSDFLGLVNFGFLDLADFATVDRFLIVPPTLLLIILVVPLGIS